MKKIHLSIHIQASREMVWHTITDSEQYRKWTKPFHESSHFEGSWNQGDKIHFVAINEQGKKEGMFSEIAEALFPEYISIRHLGFVKDGVVDTTSEEVKKWTPSFENYRLTKLDDTTTLFELDMDSNEEYYDSFIKMWSSALEELKNCAEHHLSKPIYTCLWFDGKAAEVSEFYERIFPACKILEKTPMVTRWEIAGTTFMGLNGGPKYASTPAVSFYYYCAGEGEISSIYEGLTKDGQALMPLGSYPWSRRYAWVVDRYGVNWQLDIDDIRSGQKVVPTLLFVNEKNQKVGEAMDFYLNLFSPSRKIMEAPYPLESGMPEGTLLFAQFKLGQTIFNAMSSMEQHDYDFTPGTSLVIECDTQDQIDYYWEKLGEGGQFQMCGWLTDRYGVSWQIIPSILSKLMADREKSPKVMQVFLKMQKFDIPKLLAVE